MNEIQLRKEELKQWDVQRKALETEAEAIVSELTTPSSSNGGGIMGLDTPLVDPDGYPRNDVDVYRARTLRNRLAIIRTDHKQLMKQISNGLYLLSSMKTSSVDNNEKEQRSAPKPKPKYDPITQKWVVKNWDGTVSGIENGNLRSFDQISSSLPPSITTTTNAENEQNDSTNNNEIISTPIVTQQQNKKPFAKIDQVNNNSPASEAGLQVGDDIIEFGNLTSLEGIVQLVSTAAANQTSIRLIIRRNNTTIPVPIFPKPWSGRGLLGCHIQPIYG